MIPFLIKGSIFIGKKLNKVLIFTLFVIERYIVMSFVEIEKDENLMALSVENMWDAEGHPMQASIAFGESLNLYVVLHCHDETLLLYD